jgi:hypothetical protein
MEKGTIVFDFQQTPKSYDMQFLHWSGSRQK